MEKFIAAVEKLHDGYEVIDVRFMLKNGAAIDADVSMLDDMLAHAVETATRFEPAELS